jgi:hypothetical protein
MACGLLLLQRGSELMFEQVAIARLVLQPAGHYSQLFARLSHAVFDLKVLAERALHRRQRSVVVQLLCDAGVHPRQVGGAPLHQFLDVLALFRQLMQGRCARGGFWHDVLDMVRVRRLAAPNGQLFAIAVVRYVRERTRGPIRSAAVAIGVQRAGFSLMASRITCRSARPSFVAIDERASPP